MKRKGTLLAASMLLAGIIPAVATAERTRESLPCAALEARLARDNGEAQQNGGATSTRSRDRMDKEVAKEFRSRPKAWLKGIKLNADQRRQIEQIQRRTMERLKAIDRDVDAREENGKPIGIFKERIVDLMQTMHSEMKGVLNDAQKEHFERNTERLKNPW